MPEFKEEPLLAPVCAAGFLRVLRPRSRLISIVKVKHLLFLGWFGPGQYNRFSLTLPLRTQTGWTLAMVASLGGLDSHKRLKAVNSKGNRAQSMACSPNGHLTKKCLRSVLNRFCWMGIHTRNHSHSPNRPLEKLCWTQKEVLKAISCGICV